MDVKLSIVICTYNRDKFLLNALNSLKNQSINKEFFEIVVINNNSNDTTEQICLTFKALNPTLNFNYIFEKNQGLSHARNTGIVVSKGKFIAFIDDDAIADINYARSVIEAFELYPEFDGLGGKVVPVYESNKEIKWLSKYLWGMVAKVDYGDNIKRFPTKYPAGCNMCFRKNVFSTIGNFKLDLANRCDDRYIFSQMKKHKKLTLYYPLASVNHFIPEERISEEGIARLAKLNGIEYRNLLNNSNYLTILKFFDYIFKIILAVILSLGFILIGQKEKAKITKIMYLSLQGFLTRRY